METENRIERTIGRCCWPSWRSAVCSCCIRSSLSSDSLVNIHRSLCGSYPATPSIRWRWTAARSAGSGRTTFGAPRSPHPKAPSRQVGPSAGRRSSVQSFLCSCRFLVALRKRAQLVPPIQVGVRMQTTLSKRYPERGSCSFRSWAMTVRPAARKIALIGTHMITPASC